MSNLSRYQHELETLRMKMFKHKKQGTSKPFSSFSEKILEHNQQMNVLKSKHTMVKIDKPEKAETKTKIVKPNFPDFS